MLEHSRLPPPAVQPNPELLGQGWERRFVASGARLQEMADFYRELGFEVRIEPVRRVDLPEACEDCQLAALLEFKTIYTRRPRDGS